MPPSASRSATPARAYQTGADDSAIPRCSKVCKKQSTPNKRGRRSPPSAQRRPTSVFLRVAPATSALNGDRRGCFSTPRPTSPTERTRPAASAKRNKILKDERRPRLSSSLCHKNENFQTHQSLPSLAVTSTSSIAVCDSQRRTNVLTRHSDLPYRFFLYGQRREHVRTCPPVSARQRSC